MAYENKPMGKNYPLCGEVRWGLSSTKGAHTYRGCRPYLVISNDVFNMHSGMCLCVPFSTRGSERYSPVHVKFPAGSIEGMKKDSTLMVENLVPVAQEDLQEPQTILTDGQMELVARALLIQIPFLKENRKEQVA